MKKSIYLIRHAQSHPSKYIHHSQWPLSKKGRDQAIKLSILLSSLNITKLYSSPYKRCIQTIQPFSDSNNLNINFLDDLRERLIVEKFTDNFSELWDKSWEDFNFALINCESSKVAQNRIIKVINKIISENDDNNIAISSHGNIIGLFLNYIDSSFGKEETEKIKNPDIIKLLKYNFIKWDKDFFIDELNKISTNHNETPFD